MKNKYIKRLGIAGIVTGALVSIGGLLYSIPKNENLTRDYIRFQEIDQALMQQAIDEHYVSLKVLYKESDHIEKMIDSARILVNEKDSLEKVCSDEFKKRADDNSERFIGGLELLGSGVLTIILGAFGLSKGLKKGEEN